MDASLVRFSITDSHLGVITNLEIGWEDSEDEEQSSSTGIVVDDEGEKSFALNYTNLSSELRSCLSYCCTVHAMKYGVKKEKLARLLLAVGLIQERTGGENMEDIAKEYIEKLVHLGMLLYEEDFCFLSSIRVTVPYLYHKLFAQKTNKENFLKASASSTIHNCRVYYHEDDVDGKNIPPNFFSLPIHSLSMVSKKLDRSVFLSKAYLRSVFHEVKLLRVLDLNDLKIERLPDEVGDLIHLRYLGLKHSHLNELPESLGNLQNLQTLDIRWSGWKLKALPVGVLNLEQLRHIKMSTCINDCEVRIPTGITRLKNLHTCTGLYAGGSIASELSCLTQLRKLGVKSLSDDHAGELFTSIMKMEGLISLSLEAAENYMEKDTRPISTALLPIFESFSPPPLLQRLILVGVLVEMPDWIGSLQNLTKLKLVASYLSENQTTVLQFLPKLKQLVLCDACNSKRIVREFCGVGGFPKLEYLCIASDCLVEWTELADGALPSLKHLSFHCWRLMLLYILILNGD